MTEKSATGRLAWIADLRQSLTEILKAGTDTYGARPAAGRGPLRSNLKSLTRFVAGSSEDLKRALEAGLTKTLHSFSIPTSTDVHELSDRVERLSEAVTELSARHPAQNRPARTQNSPPRRLNS